MGEMYARSAIHGKLKTMLTKAKAHATTPLTLTEVTHLLERAENQIKRAEEHQLTLLQACKDEAAAVVQEAAFEPLESTYYQLKVALYNIRTSLVPPPGSSHSSSSRATAAHSTTLQLPRIELPKFTGKYEDWPSFSDLFNATIGKTSLSGSEKLQYLKASVTGEAEVLIKHYTVTDINFAEAWKQLTTRYDNKREITFSLIRRIICQQKIQSGTVSSVQALLNTTQEAMGCLKVMGQPIDTWDTILIAIIIDKLDPETKSEWAKAISGTNVPTFEEFQQFLERHIRSLHARGIISSKPNNQPKTTNKVVSSHHTSTSASCKLCNGREHHLFQCPQLMKLSNEDRTAAVRKVGACINCLRDGHTIKTCQSKHVCKVCQKKHNTILHYNNSNSKQNPNPTSNPTTGHSGDSQSTQSVNSLVSSFQSPTSTQVLLKTAVVDVEDSFGNKQPVRVLLDDGSEASFITEACATTLGLIKEPADVIVTGISAATNARVKYRVQVRVHSQVHSAFTDVEALVLPRVTGTLPRMKCDTKSTWNHLTHLRLADPHFSEPGDVDILLGADVVAGIMREGRRQGPKNTPIAQNSIFGWVLSGRVSSSQQSIVSSNFASCSLEETLQQFWKIEEVPSTSTPLTIEERECESHFMRNHTRDGTGRYQVRLPFNEKISSLGETRHQALHRLHQLERRFKRHPQVKQEYIKFMSEYLQLGHMRPASTSHQMTTHLAYLPHHFVRKEDSTTTKLRVVFDGSSRSTTGVSLNQCLRVGATIQDDLISLLLRFRLHKVALKADITKMYRQFIVHPEDAEFQRILWREDSSLPVEEFTLSTVTYGTSCAPFLATRCLVQLANDEETNYPVATQVLRKDMYVDDLMSGEQNTKKAIKLYQDMSKLVESGAMQLRKWCSNDEAVMRAIPAEQRETLPECSFDEDNVVKTLGIQWRPTTDVFKFHVNLPSKIITTKRSLLSELAKVFDPLGWLSPTTITGKLLLQQLWMEKVDWDEQVPPLLEEKWIAYTNQIQHLSDLQIPRCVIQPDAISYELHGFADSSERALASAIYLRVQLRDGSIVVNLLISKSKVAPLRQVSLPRLELCAAKLLSDTICLVKKAINLDCALYCWTDSMIVLRWISASSRRWKTFVANRVADIQENIPIECWHHVRSEDNPADLPSRGVSPVDLINSKLWWNGPSWLQSQSYPQTSTCYSDDDINMEEKRTIMALHTTADHPDILSQFSSWRKLYTSVAWFQRYIKFLCNKETCKTGPLIVSEVNAAQQHILRMVQGQEFKDDITSLSKHGETSHSSKLRQLTPWIDDSKTLRVGGRLEHAGISVQRKHPIILPSSHHVTQLIIQHFHITHLHSGFTLTYSALRRTFWILRGRSAVRNFIRSCVTCKKVCSSTASQLMGNLPEGRVNPSKPFTHTGVDFAGPFLINDRKGRGAKVSKHYFAIFVCFATKAVHLESVSDLSTEAFIACFRRFTARRGRCLHLYSDCGRNFVGANTEFQRLIKQEQDKFQHQLVSENTEWHFNIPAASHQGGIWESGVKSVKGHFKRVVGSTTLNPEQFHTVLCNIEACLNSRPLCALSCDPLDLEPLTPGHFLMGCAPTSVPDPDLTTLKTSRLGHWQLAQQLSQSIWKRWKNEYLTTLNHRQKWFRKQNNLREGDLVIIRDDQMPPMRWRMGRVIATHPGRDGLVRSVTLKTQSGQIKRPIHKLSLLLQPNEA